MARPHQRRTVQSFERDIEYVNRLRTGLLLDDTLPGEDVARAIEAIDGLTALLLEFTRVRSKAG